MTKQQTTYIGDRKIATHLPEDLIMECTRLQEKLGLSRAALIRFALSKLVIEYKGGE